MQILYGLVSLSVLLFATTNLWLHFTHCPLDASTRDAIRRDWDVEMVRHASLLEEWRLEQQAHAVVEEEWKRQVKWHDKEVERRVEEESERQQKVREGWARETEQHRRQQEQAERRENDRQEQARRRWHHEVEDHDRIVEERRKHEEEERQKLNMFWGQVKAHTCTTYATREYTAELMNLPASWEHRVEACKVTPLEVHGISYLPKSCEDKGPGIVLGRWEVDQHEPDCASYWNRYKDKGCTSPGSGKRRIEHYLENIPDGCDWREFCATTPAQFNGLEFSGPHECYQYKSATYGLWEIDDTKCA